MGVETLVGVGAICGEFSDSWTILSPPDLASVQGPFVFLGQLFCFSVTHFRKRRGKRISRVNYLWLLYYFRTNQVYLLPLNTLPALMSSRRLTIEVKGRHLNVSSVLGLILNLSKRFLRLKVKGGGRLYVPFAVEAVS